MHKRMTLNGLALLGMFVGSTGLANAQSFYAHVGQPGFYVGAGFGQATIEVDEFGFDAHDTAFKVFGGYNINENFAVEVTYFDGGEPDQSFGPTTVDVGIDGVNFSALGRVPLGDAFSIFGKVGFASYSGDVNDGGRIVVSDRGTNDDVSYGVGGEFNWGSSFELRAEYEAVDVSNGAFNLLSVSGIFKF